MAVVLKCPLLYADAYERGGGAGAQGQLIVDIYNPMPMKYQVRVFLYDANWTLWRSTPDMLIGAGGTMSLVWTLTIDISQTFLVTVYGGPWPVSGSLPYMGEVTVAYITYHP